MKISGILHTFQKMLKNYFPFGDEVRVTGDAVGGGERERAPSGLWAIAGGRAADLLHAVYRSVYLCIFLISIGRGTEYKLDRTLQPKLSD